MSGLIVFESLAVFAIWMQRKGRWSLFYQSMGGKYTVVGSARASSSQTSSSSSSSSSINNGNPDNAMNPNPVAD